jgi:hypothetical protein
VRPHQGPVPLSDRGANSFDDDRFSHLRHGCFSLR